MDSADKRRLRRKLDILGVVSETVIWQYIWYGESPFQIYNNVDRAFYESINLNSAEMAGIMEPTLYIVGTGPGDPQLLTLKAFNIFKDCPVIVAPKASSRGKSTALSIVAGAVDLADKDIREIYFPMKKVRLDQKPLEEVELAWETAARAVIELLAEGVDVAFPTLGDPAIYSTGYYLYETICRLQPDVSVKFVSGISAMSSCSASTSVPVCLGDDMLAVVPATFSDEKILKALQEFDSIVLMKVHRVMDRICQMLADTGLLQNAIYVEKAGMEDERIIRDLSNAPADPHYFSTIIVRKQRNGHIYGDLPLPTASAHQII